MPPETVTITRNERELIVTRMFDAPLALVWKAWTDAESLKQWWGPRSYPTTYCTVDFRVGGVWHYCMTGPNGEQAWGKSTYREISDQRRIVYLDQFSDEHGTVAPDMPEMVIAVEFNERDGKTTVTSRAEFPSVEDLDKLSEMGMIQGLTETWDKLEEYLASQQ